MRSAASTVTISEVRQREAVKGVSTRTVRKNLNSRKGNDMSTVPVDEKYLAKVEAFKAMLALRQMEGFERRGEDVESVSIYIMTGRKYDQVKRWILRTDKNKPDALEVIMFIDRATGEIFGAKSPLAPHPGYIFGTLDTTDKWDWSGSAKGDHPVPFDAGSAGVEVTSTYGKFTQYRRVPVKRGRPKSKPVETTETTEPEPEKAEA